MCVHDKQTIPYTVSTTLYWIQIYKLNRTIYKYIIYTVNMNLLFHIKINLGHLSLKLGIHKLIGIQITHI